MNFVFWLENDVMATLKRSVFSPDFYSEFFCLLYISSIVNIESLKMGIWTEIMFLLLFKVSLATTISVCVFFYKLALKVWRYIFWLLFFFIFKFRCEANNKYLWLSLFISLTLSLRGKRSHLFIPALPIVFPFPQKRTLKLMLIILIHR